jgi:hypothetical protein
MVKFFINPDCIAVLISCAASRLFHFISKYSMIVAEGTPAAQE